METELNHTYFKFMSDIIKSGTWAKLSTAAKTLYPVLCSFSNETFKSVWPGTETLLKLTGLKSKKSIQQGRKELAAAKLINYIPGSGRTPTTYYFTFDYANSSIDIETYRDEILHRREGKKDTSEGDKSIPLRGEKTPPNYINIHINNSDLKNKPSNLLETFFQNNLPKTLIKKTISNLLIEFSEEEITAAMILAQNKNKKGNLQYLKGILTNKRNEQNTIKSQQKKINHNQSNANILAFIQNIENNQDLAPSFKEHIKYLNYLFEYNNITYLSAMKNMPHKKLEEEFKKLGHNVIIRNSFINQNNIKENIFQKNKIIKLSR